MDDRISNTPITSSSRTHVTLRALRFLVVTEDVEAAKQFIVKHPELQDLAVIGVLSGRAATARSAGNDGLATRLDGCLKILTGAEDPATQSLICELAMVDVSIAGDRPPCAEIGRAKAAVDQIVGGGIDGCESPLVPEIWVATTRVALRLLELTDDERLHSAAVDSARRALDHANDDSAAIIARQIDLGTALGAAFESSDDLEQLEEAVVVVRAAVKATDLFERELSKRLTRLSVLLARRYEATADPTSLDEAIEAARTAVHRSASEAGERSWALDNLADRLAMLSAVEGDLSTLDEAIVTAQEAIDFGPEPLLHPDDLWQKLAAHQAQRFAVTVDRADLDAATESARSALELTVVGHSEYASRAATVAELLARSSQVDDDESALRESIEVVRRAKEAITPQHSGWGGLNEALAARLEQFHHRNGDLAALEEAVGAARAACDATPSDSPLLEARQQRASDLVDRLEALIASRGFDEAETLLDRARRLVERSAAAPSEHARNLADLEDLWSEASGRSDHPELLEEAVGINRLLLEVSGETEPGTGRWHHELAVLLGRLHTVRPKTGTIEEAVVEARRAVELGGDAEAVARFQSTLSKRLRELTAHTGNRAELEEAIGAARKAVNLTPTDDSTRPARLSELASLLVESAAETAHQGRLEEAMVVLLRAAMSVVEEAESAPELALQLFDCIDRLAGRVEELRLNYVWLILAEGVVAATSPDDPTLAGRLTELAGRLGETHAATGSLDYLRRAAEAGRRAVAVSDPRSPWHADVLESAAHNFVALHLASENVGLIEEALALSRRVVSATAETSVDAPRRLNNLANNLARLYLVNSDRSTLEEAIAIARKSVAASRLDDPDRWRRLTNLARHLMAWADLTSDADTRHEAAVVADWASELARERLGDVPGSLESLLHELELDPR